MLAFLLSLWWNDTFLLFGIKCGCITYLVEQVVKSLPANAGDTRDEGSIPGLGRSSEKEMAACFSISCQENSMNRGAWWFTVYGVAESDTTEHSHAIPSLTLINNLFYFWVEALREPVCELTCLSNIPDMGHPTGLWPQSEEYSREASSMTHVEFVQLE